MRIWRERRITEGREEMERLSEIPDGFNCQGSPSSSRRMGRKMKKEIDLPEVWLNGRDGPNSQYGVLGSTYSISDSASDQRLEFEARMHLDSYAVRMRALEDRENERVRKHEEERNAAIEEMRPLIVPVQSHWAEIAEALYDAGYRKVEN
jgi:hypothetical protein